MYSADVAALDACLATEYEDIDYTSIKISTISHHSKLKNETSTILKNQRIINFLESSLAAELDCLQGNIPSPSSSSATIMDSDSWEELQIGSSKTSLEMVDNSPPIPTFSRNRLNGNEINQTELLFNKLHIFLPKSLQVKDIAGLNHSLLQDMGSSDNSIKQLQRDIQRDQFLIDGVRLVGADAGLEGAVEQLEACINFKLNESKLSTEIIRKRELCLAVLQCACRTNSGGISYAALQFILQTILKPDPSGIAGTPSDSSNPNPSTRSDRSLTEDLLSQYIIVPMSSLAPPLTIRVDIGEIVVDSGDEVNSTIDHSADKNKSSEVDSGSQEVVSKRNTGSKSTFRSIVRNMFTFYRPRAEPESPAILATTEVCIESSASNESHTNTDENNKKNIAVVEATESTTVSEKVITIDTPHTVSLSSVKQLRTWGLRCQVESVTVFSLKSIDDTEARLSDASATQSDVADTKLIKVLYSNIVSVPLTVSGAETYDFTVSSGLVSVSMYSSGS